ncbi:MAG TPA: hypothetical protein VGU66_01535 [Candidatus Elarobacter sp.]|nr:hypothetical protein [Candidatus Elarobacter sp.]
MADDLDRRFTAVRVSLSSLDCPDVHTIPTEDIVRIRSHRMVGSVRVAASVATVAFVALFSLAAVAGPHMNPIELARSLSQALSTATSRDMTVDALQPVTIPSVDVRTAALWQSLSSIERVEKAWTSGRSGVVVRGSLHSAGLFYVIASHRGSGTGVLLPDDAGLQPLLSAAATSRTTSYTLLYVKGTPDRERDALILALSSVNT